MSDYVYIITPAAAYVLAQALKIIFELRKDGVQLRDSWSSGGMPSVHTATIVALATVIGINGGTKTPLFAVVFVLACIVAYDAMGVRRTAGEAAIAARELQKVNKIKTDKLVHAARGHTPVQVAAGIVIGFGVGVIGALLL